MMIFGPADYKQWGVWLSGAACQPTFLCPDDAAYLSEQ